MRLRSLLAQSALVLATGVILSLTSFAQGGSWQEDNAAWRASHTADLLKPDGWLSLAGLEWLQPGENAVGSAPDNKIILASGPAHLAVLHLEGETVTLNPPAGGFPPDLLVAGTPAKPQTLRAEANKDKVSPHLTISTLNMYVIRREARFALRIKDSRSPAITGFRGLKWFPLEAAETGDCGRTRIFDAKSEAGFAADHVHVESADGEMRGNFVLVRFGSQSLRFCRSPGDEEVRRESSRGRIQRDGFALEVKDSEMSGSG